MQNYSKNLPFNGQHDAEVPRNECEFLVSSHCSDDSVSNVVWVQSIHPPAQEKRSILKWKNLSLINSPRVNIVEHSSCLNEIRANDSCVNAVSAEHLQLQSQSLVESNSGKFTRTVIDEFWNADMSGHRRDRHNVPVILFEHRGQKSFHSPKVRQRVDTERSFDELVGRVKQCTTRNDAGVIKQNCDLVNKC